MNIRKQMLMQDEDMLFGATTAMLELWGVV